MTTLVAKPMTATDSPTLHLTPPPPALADGSLLAATTLRKSPRGLTPTPEKSPRKSPRMLDEPTLVKITTSPQSHRAEPVHRIGTGYSTEGVVLHTHTASAEQPFNTDRVNTVTKAHSNKWGAGPRVIKSEKVVQRTPGGFEKTITAKAVVIPSTKKCAVCRRTIGVDVEILVEGKSYHESCLVCSVCQTKLTRHRLFLAKGNLACERCAKGVSPKR